MIVHEELQFLQWQSQNYHCIQYCIQNTEILGQESKSLQIQDSNILTGQNFIKNKFSC